jgi:hypothetical protein
VRPRARIEVAGVARNGKRVPLGDRPRLRNLRLVVWPWKGALGSAHTILDPVCDVHGDRIAPTESTANVRRGTASDHTFAERDLLARVAQI